MTKTATRIPRKRLIYSNYDPEQWYDQAKESLLMNCPDEDPSEAEIENEINFMQESWWEDELGMLSKFFYDGTDFTYLVRGAVGLWNGNFEGGFICHTFEELFATVSRHCDYWEFWDENGHFYGKCTHHDGTHIFEVKQLTRDGIKFYTNWDMADSENKRYHISEREIHKKLWDRYSTLLNYAHSVFGCKKTEYETTK